MSTANLVYFSKDLDNSNPTRFQAEQTKIVIASNDSLRWPPMVQGTTAEV